MRVCEVVTELFSSSSSSFSVDDDAVDARQSARRAGTDARRPSRVVVSRAHDATARVEHAMRGGCARVEVSRDGGSSSPHPATRRDETRRAMMTTTRGATTVSRASSSVRASSSDSARRTATMTVRRAGERASWGAHFDRLVFDLDGVLYDGANGYLAHVRRRQRAFLRERFGMSEEEAAEVRARAFEAASQCYKGLVDLGYDVEQEEFTAFCRDGVDGFLSPSDALTATLRAMPYRKIIMTNTSETQGNKALRALGLHADESDAFERVYGGVFTAPVCKPQLEAFEKVLADAGVEASRCAMFEDSFKNCKAAKALGMKTIFVRTRGERAPSEEDIRLYCDAVVDSIVDEDLRTQMPELFV